MLSIPHQVVDQILVPTLLRFLFVGGIFSLIVGIVLIFQSELLFRICKRMDRWISLRRSTRALEIPRDCWPLVLRYRYLLSAIITVGAMYSLYGLITNVEVQAITPSIAKKLLLPDQFVAWLLSSVKWFLILGSVLSIPVGLLLGFSLPIITRIETLSATWISTRNSFIARKASINHDDFDKLITSFPKTAGFIVIVLSLLEITLVGMLLD